MTFASDAQRRAVMAKLHHRRTPRVPQDRIVTGDARRGLRRLPDSCVHLILTDPPYGTQWRGRNGEGIRGDDRVRSDWLPDAYRVLKQGGAMYTFTRWDVYCQWRKAIEDAGFTVKQVLVWRKNTGGQGDTNGTYAPDGEFIVFASKGRHTFRRKRRLKQVLFYTNPGASVKLHPHQKPTELLGDLIKQSSRRGDLVVDPFMGSGSTAVAARQHERHFLGWEIDARHAATARKRVRVEGHLAPGTDLEGASRRRRIKRPKPAPSRPKRSRRVEVAA